MVDKQKTVYKYYGMRELDTGLAPNPVYGGFQSPLPQGRGYPIPTHRLQPFFGDKVT